MLQVQTDAGDEPHHSPPDPPLAGLSSESDQREARNKAETTVGALSCCSNPCLATYYLPDLEQVPRPPSVITVISCQTRVTACASWDCCEASRLIHGKNLQYRSYATSSSSSSQYYYFNYSWFSIKSEVLFHILSALGSLHTHTVAKQCCASTQSSHSELCPR